MSKIFIDSNILVYGIDRNSLKKQKQTHNALRSLSPTEGVISTQVLQEFYVTATRKCGVAPLNAKQIMAEFERFEIVIIDIPVMKNAVDLSILHQISFWDALIVASAQKANCKAIWSEDLNDGQIIGGVKIHNIFTK